MASLTSELWRRILQLRGDFCHRLCREHWKREWLKNMAAVNKEYQREKSDCDEGYNGYNHRDLQDPYHLTLLDNLFIYQYDRSHSICGLVRANFSMLHYYYSLRRYTNAKMSS